MARGAHPVSRKAHSGAGRSGPASVFAQRRKVAADPPSATAPLDVDAMQEFAIRHAIPYAECVRQIRDNPMGEGFAAAVLQQATCAEFRAEYRVLMSRVDLDMLPSITTVRPDLTSRMLAPKLRERMPLIPQALCWDKQGKRKTSTIVGVPALALDAMFRAHALDGPDENAWWRAWRSHETDLGRVSPIRTPFALSPQQILPIASNEDLLRAVQAHMQLPHAFASDQVMKLLPIRRERSHEQVTTTLLQAAPGAFAAVKRHLSAYCFNPQWVTSSQFYGPPRQGLSILIGDDDGIPHRIIVEPDACDQDEIPAAVSMQEIEIDVAGSASLVSSSRADFGYDPSKRLTAALHDLPDCSHEHAEWLRDDIVNGVYKLGTEETSTPTSGLRFACPTCHHQRLVRIPGQLLAPEIRAQFGISDELVIAEDRHNSSLDQRRPTHRSQLLAGTLSNEGLQQLARETMASGAARLARPVHRRLRA